MFKAALAQADTALRIKYDIKEKKTGGLGKKCGKNDTFFVFISQSTKPIFPWESSLKMTVCQALCAIYIA